MGKYRSKILKYPQKLVKNFDQKSQYRKVRKISTKDHKKNPPRNNDPKIAN